MTTIEVREVQVRVWFREDVDTAREMLAVVYADARRRADIARLVPDTEFAPILL